MDIDDPTDEDSLPTRPDDPLGSALERFQAELRAGLSPRIEDYLANQDPLDRSRMLRELLLAERDWRREHGLETDSAAYQARFPDEVWLVDEIFVEDGPTITLPQRDRLEIESSLLFGLLALASGLIAPDSLTKALDAWAGAPGRTLREILVEQGHFREADAAMVDALAERHLSRHLGLAEESLAALGWTVRFRLNLREVADPTLRAILSEFVAVEVGRRPDGSPGFGPRYQVVRHHANGGLGVVSLALDLEIHREVAVKEIRADCAHNADYRARFLREAEVTGRLEHPGIVPVYGMGQHEDGRPFYIMRFIRGETLKAAIARLHKQADELGEVKGPDLHALVGRFVDACHAVAYAHHRKILHRDIKPVNIMLGPFGETLVVDWGLAKSFDGPRSAELVVEEGTLRPESGSELTPTRVGSQVGTVGYMSPEQAAGRLTELAPTSDIYSLGATLHYLVTGHAPFEGAGQDEFYRRVREGDFRHPRQVNPSVPRPLEAICLKAMALRPIDRYQSAEALAEDLERWRAGQPVDAYPEPLPDRLARRAKRHKTALAGVAVMLICATVGLAIYAQQERRNNRMISDKDAASRGDLKMTRKTLGLILDRLEGPELAYLPDSGPARLQIAGEVLALYMDLRGLHPTDADVQFEWAKASRVSANIGRSMGDFGKPRQRYNFAIKLLEPLLRTDPGSERFQIELAWTHHDLGEHLRMAGKPREAEAEQSLALEALKLPVVGEVTDDLCRRTEVRSRIDLAIARLETNRPLEALLEARRAGELVVGMAERPGANQQDQLLRIYALGARASSLKATRDREGSWKDLFEAERAARHLVRDYKNTDTRFALAVILDHQGHDHSESDRHSEALGCFDESNEILADLYGTNQRFLFLEKELAACRIGRGVALLALHRMKPNPGLLEKAQSDTEKARESIAKIAKAWPHNFHYQSLQGRCLAIQARIALARNQDGVARDLLDQSMECHKLALLENRESPDDSRLLVIVRDEMKAIAGGKSGVSPGP